MSDIICPKCGFNHKFISIEKEEAEVLGEKTTLYHYIYEPKPLIRNKTGDTICRKCSHESKWPMRNIKAMENNIK